MNKIDKILKGFPEPLDLRDDAYVLIKSRIYEQIIELKKKENYKHKIYTADLEMGKMFGGNYFARYSFENSSVALIKKGDTSIRLFAKGKTIYKALRKLKVILDKSLYSLYKNSQL